MKGLVSYAKELELNPPFYGELLGGLHSGSKVIRFAGENPPLWEGWAGREAESHGREPIEKAPRAWIG